MKFADSNEGHAQQQIGKALDNVYGMFSLQGRLERPIGPKLGKRHFGSTESDAEPRIVDYSGFVLLGRL
jgi:hypothetical protein